MRPNTRIAAIVLGAFALGIVVVFGWTAVVSEAVDLSDRVRRARCDWVAPLVVMVAGHEMSIAASPQATVHTGDRWISGEEISGYRSPPERFGFCLDAPQAGPLPAHSVTLTLDAAQDLAREAGLPRAEGLLIEIGEAGLFMHDAPAPTGPGAQMVVYFRNEDYGWPRMVTEGVTGDGFRIGAVCRDLAPGEWLCDVSVQDRRLDLSYRFEHLAIEAEAFDAEPVPAPFVDVAHGMRAVGRLLQKDAVARR